MALFSSDRQDTRHRLSRYERSRGALLGVHVGDSLGATTEFMSPAQVRDVHGRHREMSGGGVFQWAPGAATDDTDLTKAVLDAYKQETWNGSIAEHAGDNMVGWMHRGPRDIGGTTAKALSDFEKSGDTWGGRSDDSSAANGSLMRCIPTGVIRHDNPGLRRAESREISAITHAEPRAMDSCVAYNEIVAGLVNGKDVDDAVDDAIRACDEDRLDPRVREAVQFGRELDLGSSAAAGEWRLRDGRAARDVNPDWHDGKGYVLDSLSISVAAAVDDRHPEDVLGDVVNMGGDSDTNGAIAGGLIGARHGTDAFPDRWVEPLEYRREFLAAGHDIVCDRYLPGSLTWEEEASERAILEADGVDPESLVGYRQAHERTDPRSGRKVKVRGHRVNLRR